MYILSHITLGTNDKQRAALFYDAVLGTIGFNRLPKPPEKPLAYDKGGSMPTIYIYTPEDGRPATWGNGTHIAFLAETKAQVHDFHTRALEFGGMSEGDPGPRPHYGANYYACYVRDPDGNKLQAVCYGDI
ncbi:MAG TPA: VOC family protein [Aestuariivirga sp.]|nr:VOC family protein [Aestuariivirga sp.]